MIVNNKENSEPIWQGFLRQRRNFILISLVIALIETIDLDFTQINILGNTSTIGRPEFVSYWLWAIFVYFTWRYFSYFIQIDRGFLTAFKQRQQQKVAAIALEQTLNLEKTKQHINFLKKIDNIDDRHDIQLHENSILSITRENDLKLYSITVQPNLYCKLTNGSFHFSNIEELKLEIKDSDLFFVNLIIILRVIFFTHHFNEYYLPILIGLSVVSMQIYLNLL